VAFNKLARGEHWLQQSIAVLKPLISLLIVIILLLVIIRFVINRLFRNFTVSMLLYS